MAKPPRAIPADAVSRRRLAKRIARAVDWIYRRQVKRAVLAGMLGERLFEFRRGPDRFRCELRDHGSYGIEAQFFRNDVFALGRRFDRSMHPTRTPRALAIRWAEDERKAIERA